MKFFRGGTPMKNITFGFLRITKPHIFVINVPISVILLNVIFLVFFTKISL